MDFTNSKPMEQGIVIEQPELNTGLSDMELNMILDSRISESTTAYSRKKIDERRKKNEKFWLGDQVDDSKLIGLPYVDNVIYQDTEHRINLATGRMPDMIVTPGDNSLSGRKNAQKIERVLDIDFSTKEKKRLIKNGLRHNHLYYIAAVKACWNPNKGKFGDYEFNLVDPHKVLLSHNGRIPEDGYTVDNCDLIVETVEEPVATVMAKFPHKRQELMEALAGGKDGSRLATTMKYQEAWYTYHSKDGQIIEGVCWRYQHVILRNIRNPYFDFQGYDRPVYDNNGQVVINQLNQVQTEKLFRNFFERPRKPYILFSYQNLGKGPLDDTTAVEQSLSLQQNLNKAGKQIRDIAAGMTNKYAFNNMFSQDQARMMTAGTQQYIWADTNEDIRTGVTTFRSDGPPPSLFNEAAQLRQQIDAKFNTHGTIRGETNAAESGISKQITREGDLVTSDDMVEIVVERVIEEMSGWALQFMKYMYVDAHFKSKMGTDGEVIQEWIQRDMIDDGVSVSVRSSTVDKSTARNEAIQLAETGAIDPLTMFEEMDAPNPRERARRLLLFKMGEGAQGDAFANYMNEVGITMQPEQAGAQMPGEAPVPPGVPPQAAGAQMPPDMLAQMTGGMPPQPVGVPGMQPAV